MVNAKNYKREHGDDCIGARRESGGEDTGGGVGNEQPKGNGR